jgi:hypothetical protein
MEEEVKLGYVICPLRCKKPFLLAELGWHVALNDCEV